MTVDFNIVPCIPSVPWRTRKVLPVLRYEYRLAVQRYLRAIHKAPSEWADGTVCAFAIRFWAADVAELRSKIEAVVTGAPTWTDRDGNVYDHTFCLVGSSVDKRR